MVLRDLHIADAERTQQLSDELLEVLRVELPKLREHLLLSLGVVLGDVLFDAGLQPGRQTDHALAVSHEARLLAALLGTRVLLDYLGRRAWPRGSCRSS